MTLESIPRFTMGGPPISLSGVYTVLDGANEKIGHCGYFVTPDGATRSITHICFSTQTVTTGDDILCQLESIDATTGIYNGIIAADRSGTQTIGNADDNAWFETALTTPYTLTSGTYLAVTLKMINASKSMRINKGALLSGNLSPNMNWVVEDTTSPGSPAKAGYSTNVALKCSDGTYIVPIGGDANILNGATSINSSSTVYLGNKIICHVESRIKAVKIPRLDMDYDLQLVLCNSSGTVQKGDDSSTDMIIVYDKDYRAGTSAVPDCNIDFPCPKTLSADTAYYLVLVAQSADNTSVTYLDYTTENLKNQIHGIPTDWHCNYVSSPAVVSFTEDASAIVCLYPIFDQIDFPAAGGGIWMPRARQIGV